MTGLGIAELLNALIKLDKLLGKHRIGYIVIGSLADHLLGMSMIEPDDIDILVSRKSIGELNTVFQQEQGITMLESVGWQEKATIRGLYGKALLDRVVIDIIANMQLKYGGKWLLFTYEDLLPCTTKVRLTNSIVTVRVPCPEIQVVANEALGRLDRARAIKYIMGKEKCNVRIDYCILTVDR